MNPVFNFCFKGARNYVHGTDVVAKLLEYFSNDKITALDVKFNGVVSSNLVLLDGNEKDNAKVNIRFLRDNDEKVMQLVENGEQINCRYEYNEEDIIDKTEFDLDNQQISLKDRTGFSLCENFVAMNKSLLQMIYPEVTESWYFTRLELKNMIPNDALVAVKLIKNFNFRLVKSDILLCNEKVGSVYFTLLKDKT